jgi:hypothetical protein
MGRVVMGANIRKESVRIDGDGNQIDPKTKQIIKLAGDVQGTNLGPVQPPTTPGVGTEIIDPPPMVLTPKLNTLAEINATIKKVESHLTELKELKKAKVAEMKKELEEAETE